jgi:hypothetical protein
VNVYTSDIPATKNAEQMMHPVANCAAQVDLVLIEEQEYLDNRAILHEDDPDMTKRMEIMRGRQMVNSDQLARMFPAESMAAKQADAEKQPAKIKLAQ